MTHPSLSVHPVRRAAAGVAALLLVPVLGACGGADDEPEAGAGPATTSAPAEAPESSPATASGGQQESEAVTVTAVDFGYDLAEDGFRAGDVELTLVNDGDATHDLVVERDGEDVAAAEAVGPGQSSAVTVTLEPGTYVFYCSIGNHRAMGMEITIEVA